jgi:Fe-S oxidoreductase
MIPLRARKKEQADSRRRALMYCTYCPKLCSFSCPVSEATACETLTPWGKQSILFEVDRSILPPSEEYCSVFFACLECHRCMTFCEHAVDVPGSLRTGRQRAFSAKALPPAVAAMHGGLREREEIVRNVLEAQFPLLKHSGSARLLLMPGCVTALRDLRSVESAVRIVRELVGDEFGIFSRHCCGLPFLHAGDIEGFRVAARCVADAVREARTIVVMDPGCAFAMSRHYRDHGVRLEPKVLSFVEFAAPYLNHFRNKVRIAQPVVYHDPCHLGRDLGVLSEPRDILMKIVAGGIRDIFHGRERSLCCGGGGALPESMPETAEAIASGLVQAFKKAGAASVVTACPTCKSMISKAGGSPEVFDIADLIAMSL